MPFSKQAWEHQKQGNPIVPHVRASLGNSLFADFSQKPSRMYLVHIRSFYCKIGFCCETDDMMIGNSLKLEGPISKDGGNSRI